MYVKAIGYVFHGLLKIKVFNLLYEADRIPGLSTAETLEEAFVGMYQKGRSLFLLEGTEAFPTRTCSLQVYVWGNDIVQVYPGLEFGHEVPLKFCHPDS